MNEQGVVVHTCYLSTQEAEARGSLRILKNSRLELHSESISLKKKKQQKPEECEINMMMIHGLQSLGYVLWKRSANPIGKAFPQGNKANHFPMPITPFLHHQRPPRDGTDQIRAQLSGPKVLLRPHQGSAPFSGIQHTFLREKVPLTPPGP